MFYSSFSVIQWQHVVAQGPMVQGAISVAVGPKVMWGYAQEAGRAMEWTFRNLRGPDYNYTGPEIDLQGPGFNVTLKNVSISKGNLVGIKSKLLGMVQKNFDFHLKIMYNLSHVYNHWEEAGIVSGHEGPIPFDHKLSGYKMSVSLEVDANVRCVEIEDGPICVIWQPRPKYKIHNLDFKLPPESYLHLAPREKVQGKIEDWLLMNYTKKLHFMRSLSINFTSTLDTIGFSGGITEDIVFDFGGTVTSLNFTGMQGCQMRTMGVASLRNRMDMPEWVLKVPSAPLPDIAYKHDAVYVVSTDAFQSLFWAHILNGSMDIQFVGQSPVFSTNYFKGTPLQDMKESDIKFVQENSQQIKSQSPKSVIQWQHVVAQGPMVQGAISVAVGPKVMWGYAQEAGRAMEWTFRNLGGPDYNYTGPEIDLQGPGFNVTLKNVSIGKGNLVGIKSKLLGMVQKNFDFHLKIMYNLSLVYNHWEEAGIVTGHEGPIPFDHKLSGYKMSVSLEVDANVRCVEIEDGPICVIWQPRPKYKIHNLDFKLPPESYLHLAPREKVQGKIEDWLLMNYTKRLHFMRSLSINFTSTLDTIGFSGGITEDIVFDFGGTVTSLNFTGMQGCQMRTMGVASLRNRMDMPEWVLKVPSAPLPDIAYKHDAVYVVSTDAFQSLFWAHILNGSMDIQFVGQSPVFSTNYFKGTPLQGIYQKLPDKLLMYNVSMMQTPTFYFYSMHEQYPMAYQYNISVEVWTLKHDGTPDILALKYIILQTNQMFGLNIRTENKVIHLDPDLLYQVRAIQFTSSNMTSYATVSNSIVPLGYTAPPFCLDLFLSQFYTDFRSLVAHVETIGVPLPATPLFTVSQSEMLVLQWNYLTVNVNFTTTNV
ncbi:unnamed protein product [Owenia fusiformis]|uniref:Uncharacterized protein n=1 Tax=Owenia fusiformis TaxID=6347 RepID=A0A8S4NN29_OWEFU|nr:unnamed protein product [Owenia fusiformis]